MDRRYDPNTTAPSTETEGARVPGDWLVGSGEMAEAIRSLDWSATALGARERWPESLRTVVNLLVASRFPMALLWGRELLLVYNDAYRVVAGGRHPAALGRPMREIWPEVWHVDERTFAAVMERGETVYLEDACFPICRDGRVEDTYFTLCYSPVRVEGGGVGGTLVMLEETTARVAERKHAREILRESTRLLHAISDTSADVIFAKDRAGRMRFANPATLALIGKTAAEVIGKTDADFLVDPAAARAVMENDRRVMEHGVAEDVEERVPLPDGTERIWFSRKSPLRDAAGEVVGLVGIARDITDRKRAEEAVRASEERYRSLFTNMTEGFAVGEPILDEAGVARDVRFLEMNAAFERQTGLEVGRTRGRPLREVLPGLEREWVEAYAAVALLGKPVRFENYNRDLGRHFDVYCYRPEPGRFAIVFTDITARKRAEEASAREHDLVARLVERLPVMITMYHPKLGGFRFNDAFKRILGWTEGDAASGDLMALAYPDPKVRAEASDHMTSLAPGWREFPVVAKDGTIVPSTWANLRLSDDTQVGIGIDLRERKQAEAAVRDSERRLRRMIDANPIGVLTRDRSGRVLYANAAFLRMIHASREDLAAGRVRWDEITPGEHRARDDEASDEAEARGVSSLYEKDYVLRDGTRVPVLIGMASMGVPGELTAFVVDLTERKRAEDAVREAEERFRAVVEALPSGLIVADLETRDLHWNREAFAIHGYDGTGDVHRFVETLIADHDLRTVDGEPIPVDRWPLPRLLAGETFRDCEVRVRNVRLGWERVFSYSADVIPARGRTAATGLLAIQDITDRKRAEEALRDNEQRLRSVLENMAEGLVIFDGSGNITHQNPASVRIHDRKLSGEHRRLDQLVVNWRVRTYPDGSVVPPARWAIPRVLRGESVHGERFFVDCIEDPARSFVGIYSGSPVHDAHGRFAYGFLTIEDITDQARAEAALREANEKLVEADRRKDEFLGMLSHELRNPLAPIRNSLYILDRAEANREQARRAKEIANRQLAHMTRLVDDLLDVTRIARGKIELRRAELDLAALVLRTAEDHRQLMQDRHVDLVLELPDDPVLVDGDETRLAQVIGNLLHNAAKFTPGGGRVTVSVAADGTDAVLRVRDTGAGIDAAMMGAIFEPFTQAKQTLARSEGGLGLGLALVKGLVALHGGEVAASSEGPGRGTEFAVTLPLATAHRDRATDARTASVTGRAERLRVLVIDDNHDAADSLAQLVTMLGHDVDVTYDAFDGLAKVTDAMPDVVLCDIGLPGMDGYEFARQLRALSSSHRVRLVAVSGYAQPEDVARAVEAGFDAHVAKPPDPDQLAGMLG